MAIEATAVTTRRRDYPHLDGLEGNAYLVARLLYDQVYRLQDRLDALEATVTDLIEASNSQETTVERLTKESEATLAIEQQP